MFKLRSSAIITKIRMHPNLFLCFELSAIAVGAYLWWRLPSPGVAVGILGLVAAIVTIQGQMSEGQKILWTFAVFILLVVEIRSINHDRVTAEKDRQAAQKAEADRFQKIADGINASIKAGQEQFKATMNRSSRIMAGVTDSVKVQTGGDSFAYITLTAEPANNQLVGFQNDSKPWFMVAITSHGKYPLRNVYATMVDDERRFTALQEYSKHPEGSYVTAVRSGDTYWQHAYLRPQSPEARSGDVEVLGGYPMWQGNSKKLSIHFSSLNGYWNEALHMGLIDGTWHQCLSVMGPTAEQANQPFIWCDSDWPEGKAMAEKDWPKPPVRKR